MVEARLYVEGGGDSKVLHSACRRGFSEFLRKAGLQGSMPRIVACGGRRQAFDDFCTAVKQKKIAVLLVDSEVLVTDVSPWRHLLSRPGDQWAKPAGVTDDGCHLMVQCMESWFLADRQSLAAFFGQGFQANQLPAEASPIESINKDQLLQSLVKASRQCKTKSSYGKSEHSFLLLAKIDPAKVIQASPWADRFVKILKRVMAR